MNLDLIKNLPFLPGKILDRRSLIPGKTTLQGDFGTKIITQLHSKFSEEVIEALKIIIRVFPCAFPFLINFRHLLKETKFLISYQKS